MSMMIPCPHCGERPAEEFVYGEIPTPPDTLTDEAAIDLDRAFMRSNPEGVQRERWFHLFGCRRWVDVARDTRDDSFHGSAA
jgi:heterotetrameric sarcosine oxidase delta subunit